MIFKIFSVFDSKAETYNTPLFLPAAGQAIRAFEDQANEETSEIYKHPEDYTLFEIGTFDSDIGKVEPLQTPKSLGVAIEFKKEA